MTLRLHNTLTGRKDPFEPADTELARVYVCGPTVYDYAHLGHARACIVYDVLVRHMRAHHWNVRYVRNITDIDDKIIDRAKQHDDDPTTLAKRFTEAYHEDMHRLGNADPDFEPKVSDHLGEIVDLVKKLVDKGYAYQADGDIYFDVQSFDGYGKLSHRDLEELAAGASGRTSDAEAQRKRHAADFAVWKHAGKGEPGWDSPWGPGRPGWHIECSAMSMRYLGESFDLHGGGLDLVFPHHENELAQSEAATGKPFVRFWVHNGFVEIDKQKMSKSLGNFFTVRELFDRVEPEAIRYVMLTRHYRAPLSLDWTLDEEGHVLSFPQFEEAESRLEYLYSTHKRLRELSPKRIVDTDEPAPPEIAKYREGLGEALDDDLNFPVALAKTSEMLRAVNEFCDRAKGKKGKVPKSGVEAAREAMSVLGEVLGLGNGNPDESIVRIRNRRARGRGLDPDWIDARVQERTEARGNKDYETADRVRDELAEHGVELHDGPNGTSWTVH